MTLTPSVRAMSLCSFPRVASSFACASFVAISALECLLFLTVSACIRPSPCCYTFLLRLGGTKRASCPCPDYKPAINMVNMRVGGYVIPRITCARTVAHRAHCRRNPRGSRGGNHLKGWMLGSSCHPPLPPAGGLPVYTGPDFKKKKKKDRGKS